MHELTLELVRASVVSVKSTTAGERELGYTI